MPIDPNLKAYEEEVERQKKEALAKQKQQQQEFEAGEKAAQAADNSSSQDYWDQECDAAWEEFLAKTSVLTQGMKGYDSFISIVSTLMEWSDTMALAGRTSLGKRGLLPFQLLVSLLEAALAAPANLWGGAAALAKGDNLAMPESVLESAQVDAKGQVTFKPLAKDTDAPEIKEAMVAFDLLNQKLHRAFLAKHGYAEEGGVYKKEGVPLTQATFDALKHDPKDGFAHYSGKRFKLGLRDLKTAGMPGPEMRKTPEFSPRGPK